MRAFLRLFAPFLPYVTEEVWSWRFAADDGPAGSIHVAAWPTVAEMEVVAEPTTAESFVIAAEVLGKIRGAKTREKRNLRWPVAKLQVGGPSDALRALEAVLPDVLRAGAVAPDALELTEGPVAEGERVGVEVTLAQEAS